MYKCPFCGMSIEDNIDTLRKHRKTDGDCDKAMEGKGRVEK